MSILTSTNEKLKYQIDHNSQPRSDCTNCPGKDSQLNILHQKVDEMKLQHHEMVLQQEINKSDLENANKLSKNEIQTLNNRISLLEKENSILDQNIHKKCEIITNLEEKY